MAVVAHLVERVDAPGKTFVNGIRACIVAVDGAVDTTDALVRARAVTVLVAKGLDIPVGYFDANRPVATTFDAAGDHACFSGFKLSETVAA